MKIKLLAFFFLLISSVTLSQPPNDDCSGAQNLGTLGAPGACGLGVINGATTAVAGTLVAATPEVPYVTLTGCGMASPANSVWYMFTAPVNGFGVVISITGATFTNPNIALYSGGVCSGLAGVGCIVGAGGTASLNIASGIVPGNTYTIFISGNTGQTGTFNLNVNAYQDCSNCLNAASLTISPLPVNGSYQPGQTVHFCYHIDQYTQVSNNWLHGVQLTFGAGWNLGSLVTYPPPPLLMTPAYWGAFALAPCGSWAYYPAGAVISAANGTVWPAGFYFDGDYACCDIFGNYVCITDGDPGNNFGDGVSCNNCYINPLPAEWDFCWDITVTAGCNPGMSLAVGVNTSGDGESGAWTSAGCSTDGVTAFNALVACCPPTMAATGCCANVTTGSATATPVGAVGGYVYSWAPGGQVTATATTLTPGTTYTVTVTDANLCAATNTVLVPSFTVPTANAVANITECNGATVNVLAFASVPAGATFAWTNSNTAIGLGAGGAGSIPAFTGTNLTGAPISATITVTPTSAAPQSCVGNPINFTITINPTPAITVNSPTICAGATANLTATGGTTYTWTAGVTVTGVTTGDATPVATTTYTVTGTTATCSNTAIATVTVDPLPVVLVNSPTICPGGTANLVATGAASYTWTAGPVITGLGTADVSPATTTSYTVTGTTGLCSSTAVATVTVAAALNVTVNSPTICSGATATLTAAGATTYAWTAGVTVTGVTTGDVTPLVTTTYTVTGTSGGCTGTAIATVTVDPTPVTLVNSPTICPGGTANLVATGATSYTWTAGPVVTGLGTADVSPVATTSYTVTGTTGLCSSTAIATVTIGATLTVTVDNPEICDGATATMTAGGATTYAWTAGATSSGVNTATASPNATTTYTVTGTTGGCTGTAVSTVTVDPLPVVANPATIHICSGDAVNLVPVSTILGSTFTWTATNPPGDVVGYTAVGSGGSITDILTLTGGGTGNVQYDITVTGPAPNFCVGNTVNVNVNVHPTPVITPANITICSGDNAVINPVVSTGSSLTWTAVTSLPGVITGFSASGTGNINEVITNSGAVPGTVTYTIIATASAFACVSLPVDFVVTVNPTPPLPTATTLIVYCKNDVTVPLTATGTNLLWYTVAAGGAGSAVAPTPSSAITGTFTWWVSQTILGCEGPRLQIDVTINPIPGAPAVVSPINYCVNSTAVALTATGTNLLWYTVAAGGIGTAIAPTPITTTVGTTSYWVSQTSNGCEGPRAQIDVIIDPLPPIPVVTTPVTYCQNDVAATLTAAGAGILWYTTAVGGVGSAVPPTPSTATAGTTSHYVSQTVATCEGPRAQIDVIVNPTPVAPTVTTPVNYCVNDVAVPLTATGTALLWYNAALGGVGSAAAPTPVTTTAGATNYYVSQTLLGCEGPRAVIVVNITALPTVTVTSPTICIGATATMTGGGATTYTWSAGATSTGVTTATASPVITTTYTVTGTVLGCSNTAISTVTVNPLPIITVTSPSICVGAVATMTASGGTSYTWSAGATPALVNTATATPAVTGTYTVTGTALGCSNTAVSTVTVHPLPTAFISGYGSVCAGQPTPNITITFTGTAPWTFTYVHNAVPVTLTVGITPYTISSPTAGTYTITALSDAFCTGAFSGSGIIYVHPIPVAAFSSVPNSGCLPLCVNFTDLSTVSSGGVSQWNWDFGDGNAAITANTTECYYASGTYSVTLTVTSDSGCTNSVTQSNLIHVYPVPTASFTCPFVTSFLDPRVQFSNSSLGATTYVWNFGDPNCAVAENQSNAASPQHTYSVTGTYCVQLIAANNNCYDTTRLCLVIEPEFTFYVPNSFSPNDDGVNDEFFGKGENISWLEMWIYDRWGNVVFHGNGYNDHWNGTMHGHTVQEDVYVYVIKLRDFRNADHKYIGSVTVVR